MTTETEQRRSLVEQLGELCGLLAEQSFNEEGRWKEYLQRLAVQVGDLAQQCQDEYVRVKGGEPDEVPTAAQGIALARFMRSRWNGVEPARKHVRVSRGGAGLPDTYLYVYFPEDAYEGGIDVEGRVST